MQNTPETREIITKIDELIKNNDIVLFMKGSAQMPLCGFSSVVAAVLNKFNLAFVDINVLESEEMRQGIKDYSDWPTIPQLYIKGDFIGGCDIVREMYENGEFRKLLESKSLL